MSLSTPKMSNLTKKLQILDTLTLPISPDQVYNYPPQPIL